MCSRRGAQYLSATLGVEDKSLPLLHIHTLSSRPEAASYTQVHPQGSPQTHDPAWVRPAVGALTRKKPGCGTHNPLPYPPSPVRSKGAAWVPQFHELWSGGRALTWGPPGGGRWWCWRRGLGLALVGWRRGCPAGGSSMRGKGPAGGPGAAGLGEPRADGPACGSASSPGAASSDSGSSAAPEGRAPEEHRAWSPGWWQWRR